MQIVCSREGATLRVALTGEIDQHFAAEARAKLDPLLGDGRIRRLIFDLSGVAFMDSSGVGMILGRYRKLMSFGGSMDITGAKAGVDRVLRMSGVYALCTKGGGI